MLRKTLLSNQFLEHKYDQQNNNLFTCCFQSLIDKNSVLWLSAITKDGRTVIIEIKQFKPFFYIKPDKDWGTDDDDIESEAEELKSTLNEACKTHPNQQDVINDIELVKMTPFIGFTNFRKDSLLKVVCENIRSYKKLIKELKFLPYDLLHHEFSFANQFLQQTQLQYQDWIQIKNFLPKTIGRLYTKCGVEGIARLTNISKYTNPDTTIPPILKCFVRMKAISRDGCVDKFDQYHPDPKLKADRIIAVALQYVWSYQADSKPCKTILFTLFPDNDKLNNDHKDVHVISCENETNLIDLVEQNISSYDPDILLYYPDYYDTFKYMARRKTVLKCETGLLFERFKGLQARSYDVGGKIRSLKLISRVMFDMQATIIKKVFILAESYELKVISTNSSFRKVPEDIQDFEYFTDFDINKSIITKAGQEQICKFLLFELNCLNKLERDTGMTMEFIKISTVADTNLSDVVSRGEQIRVFNKLTHFCVDNGLYVNKSKIADGILRFPIATHPPTYPDPPDHKINLDYRAECLQNLQKKRNYHPPLNRKGSKNNKRELKTNLFDIIDNAKNHIMNESDEEDNDDDDDCGYFDPSQVYIKEEISGKKQKVVKLSTGGNVCKPSPKSYKEERIFVEDFKSLYPSIMIAYNICYSTLVFDEEYMNLPGVDYIFVSINPSETVAIACVKGLIPKLLVLLLESRGKVKKQMKTEKDKFKKSILDKEQNSIKILCNAVYGFCGAGGKSAMLAVKPVLFVVTSLGRYLQKKTSDFLLQKYGIITVYGDTDSVFIIFPFDEFKANNEPIENFIEYIRQHFDMDSFQRYFPKYNSSIFTWESVIEHYKTNCNQDVTSFTRYNQINAILYLLSDKVCEEVNEIFPHPIILEFENMSKNTELHEVKKCYCYQFFDPGNCTKEKKIKVTGMEVKKRAYTPWTRSLLNKVMNFILYDKENQIKSYLTQELNKLLNGQVDVNQLKISKKFKSKLEYKSFRSEHLQVVLKREKRERWEITPGSRVYYLIIRGSDKMYLRSETPEYVKKHNLPIDYEYYLTKNFYKPMKKLLVFHPEIFNFEEFYLHFVARMKLLNENQTDLSNLSNTKLLTLKDIIKQSKKKQKIKKAQPKKSNRESQNNCVQDPFSGFY
jgi:DNA polymerase elongation subunit (family B)